MTVDYGILPDLGDFPAAGTDIGSSTGTRATGAATTTLFGQANVSLDSQTLGLVEGSTTDAGMFADGRSHVWESSSTFLTPGGDCCANNIRFNASAMTTKKGSDGEEYYERGVPRSTKSQETRQRTLTVTFEIVVDYDCDDVVGHPKKCDPTQGFTPVATKNPTQNRKGPAKDVEFSLDWLSNGKGKHTECDGHPNNHAIILIRYQATYAKASPTPAGDIAISFLGRTFTASYHDGGLNNPRIK